MKLLTLNAHSLLGEDAEARLLALADFLRMEQPDVVALQEANQTADAPLMDVQKLKGLTPSGDFAVREDNFAARLATLMEASGIECGWTWLPVKRGYGIFDEGLAVLCLRRRILETHAARISRSEHYFNWKTRSMLGVRVEDLDGWFYSVHTGWWKDDDEPFAGQWARLEAAVGPKRRENTVWLMGDFNSPAEVRGEGYDLMRNSWFDAWTMAGQTDGGATVEGSIDGWKDGGRGLRIDHIWCSCEIPVRRAGVVLDGRRSPRVSDHSGVLAEYNRGACGAE